LEIVFSVVAIGSITLVLFKRSLGIGDVDCPEFDVGGEDGVLVLNAALVVDEVFNSLEFSILKSSSFVSEFTDEVINITEKFRDEVIKVSGVDFVVLEIEFTSGIIDVTITDVLSGLESVV
jgi:hypothetical protein